MKDYEKSRFAQPFLSRYCMFCAYTRPRYQVSVYRTIGPLIYFIFLEVVVVGGGGVESSIFEEQDVYSIL